MSNPKFRIMRETFNTHSPSYSFAINLPADFIKQLQWQNPNVDGKTELKLVIKENSIIITKHKFIDS